MLIKDFMLLKNQKQFFVTILVFAFLFFGMYDDTTFAFTYIVVLCTLFTISTISYDEYDNGMSYLFTLPISRKGYVKEKYVFGIISICIALIASTVLYFVFRMAKNQDYGVQELLIQLFTSLMVAMFMLAFSLPIQLKFGAEKSRIALLAVFGCIVAMGIIVVKLGESMNLDMGSYLAKVNGMRPQMLIAAGILIGIFAIFISCLISLRIIKKKEF
ncbi:MAG: ABC-2 transporter permease [Thermoflexaceae bacterium]|nr:ABC-2 transporter permease [Thermoflexaceae bacterium]